MAELNVDWAMSTESISGEGQEKNCRSGLAAEAANVLQ